MVKRYKKTQDLELYTIKGQLDGHIFAFGRTGAGKSVSTKSIIEGFHDNYGYKVWDMYGGERNEGVFWTIPSQAEGYWRRLGVLGQMDEAGPKQYKVNLIYPYFESKLPKKLPKKQPWVKSKLFTLPLKSITIEDIRMVCGNLSESSIYAWNEILFNAKKTDNAGSLLDLADNVKGIYNTSLYKNFIVPMHREKFLMDAYNNYNLDIIEEAKDKEAVTVLCLDFVPESFHLFVMNYIMRVMAELIDVNKVGKKNLLFIREAATFFRATEDSVLEDRFKIFRTTLSHYIRMGRRGQYFALDCQSIHETAGLVSGSEDFMLMFKTQSFKDKEDMTFELRREKRMRPNQVADLGMLDKGQCYVAESGRNVRKIQVTLPRTMFWKNSYGNFYKVLWERFDGQWQTTEQEKDEINLKWKEAKSKSASAPKQPQSQGIAVPDPNLPPLPLINIRNQPQIIQTPKDNPFEEKSLYDEIA